LTARLRSTRGLSGLTIGLHKTPSLPGAENLAEKDSFQKLMILTAKSFLF
jgi:hypothetical protein